MKGAMGLGQITPWQKLRGSVRALEEKALWLWFAARDPRTPLWVKVLALLVASYAFSPIDLIPDFVPLLGYLDDLVLVPLGVALVVRFIPAEVMESARMKAVQVCLRPRSRLGAVLVILFWIAIAAGVVVSATKGTG